MRVLIGWFICMLPILVVGQQSFVKSIDRVGSNQDRILHTQDNGTIVSQSQNQTVLKFDACGNPEWQAQINVLTATPTSPTLDIIESNDGGVVSLFSHGNQVILTKIDQTGALAWSKSVAEIDHDNYPYSIVEDSASNLFIFGNAIPHLAISEYKSFITKLDVQGNVIWSKSYRTAPIWGGAILTKDYNLVCRAGNFIFKVDANTGDVEWARYPLQVGRYHLPPIEVDDGYVFSTERSNGSIMFFKLDKQGGIYWRGAKITNIKGQPTRMTIMPSNRFATIMQGESDGVVDYSIVIFDSDMAKIQEGKIKNVISTETLVPSDIVYNENDGLKVIGRQASSSNLFFSQISTDFDLDCDSLTNRVIVNDFSIQNDYQIAELATYNATSFDQPTSLIAPVYTEQLFCNSYEKKQVDLGTDITMCTGESTVLENVNADQFDAYEWSTGAQSSSITVTDAGEYWVRAIDECQQDTVYDTLQISLLPVSIPNLGDDLSICEDSLAFIGDETCLACDILWNTGDTAALIQPETPGVYSVEFTNTEGCKASDSINFEIKKCDSEYFIPNVFTPNQDGINDLFLISSKSLASFEMKIYNRWGQMIFESNAYNEGWDGRTKSGQKVPAGTYFYRISMDLYRNEKIVTESVNGTLTLIR